VRIHIEGYDLPGRDVPGRRNVHVGVQRRGRPAELLDLQPGDTAMATWTLDCAAATVIDGCLDARGPYIQGGPRQRFIYLSWGEVDDVGAFVMFRRAKLWLDGVDTATAQAAIANGRLTASLGLTDAEGCPLCATVRPPKIAWSAT
jgi:hypothetical protein